MRASLPRIIYSTTTLAITLSGDFRSVSVILAGEMALFARRTLQRILDENAAFLSEHQLSKICGVLNTASPDVIPTEWEQVILNAASKVGNVLYEQAFGEVRPNLFLRTTELELVADVTAPSDKGLHHANPADALSEEFSRRAQKRGLVGGFDNRIDEHPCSVYRGSTDIVRLKLPQIGEFNEKIFNAQFDDFLSRVRESPESLHQFDVVTEDTGVHFSYDPKLRGFTRGQHRSYTVANRIDQNPVYNALKRKGDTLKATGFTGIKGIFLCDAGCNALHSPANNWASYSADEMVRRLFRQFDSIAFVATFVVKEDWEVRKRAILAKLDRNPTWRVDFSALQKVIARIHQLLPVPVWSPENAMSQIRSNRMATRYLGELKSGGNVRVSAREILEILAGNMTVEEFEQNYRFTHDQNPFRQMLNEGRLISRVNIERIADKDDDAAIFEFGPPDAAVTPFRISTTVQR